MKPSNPRKRYFADLWSDQVKVEPEQKRQKVKAPVYPEIQLVSATKDIKIGED